MAYIGNAAQTAFTSFDKQTITGDGTATYTLSHSVANEQEIEVFVNNVRQEGGSGKAYTVSGNQITFSENIASTDDCYVVFQGKAVQTVVPPAGSVTDSMITGLSSSKLTGALPALDGSNLTGVGVAGISSSSTSGTAMSINSSNIISYPTRPRVLLRGYSSQSGGIINGWQETTYNTGFTITNGTIVVPADGFYQVDAMMILFSSASHPNFFVQINGTNYQSQFALNNWDSEGLHYHQALELTSGDVIRMGWNTGYAGPASQLYSTTLGCYLIG